MLLEHWFWTCYFYLFIFLQETSSLTDDLVYQAYIQIGCDIYIYLSFRLIVSLRPPRIPPQSLSDVAVDMHCHTTESDGDRTAEEQLQVGLHWLVEEAKILGDVMIASRSVSLLGHPLTCCGTKRYIQHYPFERWNDYVYCLLGKGVDP